MTVCGAEVLVSSVEAEMSVDVEADSGVEYLVVWCELSYCGGCW